VSVTEPQQPKGGEEIQEFKGRASPGAVWVGVGHGAQQGLRLPSNLILTRLLFEEHFGGFPGAMRGLAASDVVRYLVSTIGVLRFGLDGRAQDFKMTLPIAASAFTA